MAEAFPRTMSEMTPAWLSQVLGATVTDYQTTFLEGGVLADAFKLHTITYTGDAGQAPASVVVKMANQVKERRDFALLGNAYSKELRFFMLLAQDMPITIPKVYGCFTDGSPNDEYFLLIMEDLTTHSKVFDQVDDPPNEAFARRIALEAAKLHAQFWESATLQLPWIGRPDKRYVFSLDSLSQLSHTAWPGFRALYHQMYGEDIFAQQALQPVAELTALLCGPKCRGIHDRIYAILSARPRTLLHGDMRADNVFRTNPALGRSAADSTLTFIDWQVLHAGPPGVEFTQAWMHSLEPEVRRHDTDMLAQYHKTLVALNPAAANYTYAMLLEDYTLGYCFWWTAIITLGLGTLPLFDKPEGQRMKHLWGKGLSRAMIAMGELDCLSHIQRLAADLPDDPLLPHRSA